MNAKTIYRRGRPIPDTFCCTNRVLEHPDLREYREEFELEGRRYRIYWVVDSQMDDADIDWEDQDIDRVEVLTEGEWGPLPPRQPRADDHRHPEADEPEIIMPTAEQIVDLLEREAARMERTAAERSSDLTAVQRVKARASGYIELAAIIAERIAADPGLDLAKALDLPAKHTNEPLPRTLEGLVQFMRETEARVADPDHINPDGDTRQWIEGWMLASGQEGDQELVAAIDRYGVDAVADEYDRQAEFDQLWVGAYIEAGEGEDYDFGVIHEVGSDGVLMVGWDSGATTAVRREDVVVISTDRYIALRRGDAK